MYLGIDTSCYTTSMAIVDQDGKIIKDSRQLLKVNRGERGLQQSKAVWQHMNTLPLITEELFTLIEPSRIKAVAVSAKPRPVNDSYLPVFSAGIAHARTIASSLRIPLFLTTHQEGHLMAGCGQELLDKSKFLALHLSGGTSELLKVSVNQHPFGFSENILGRTLDLHAGQFIDRVGVALGLPFPSGPSLEKLAHQVGELTISIPSVTRNMDFSFSGPESSAQRLIAEGTEGRQVARAVEQCIVNTLRKIIIRAVESTGLKEVLIVGGVSANAYIRKILISKFKPKNISAYFAEPKYSSDNAVGVALICGKLHQ